MKCPICNKEYSKLMRHIKNTHPELYEQQRNLAIDLFNSGLTLRKIADKTLWSFGSGLSELVSKTIDKDILKEIKKNRIIKTLLKGYRENKYNTKGRGRKKKMLKKQATKWDDKIPLDFPKTNNISTKQNAPPDEVLIWKGNKLNNKYLRSIDSDERDEIAKDIFNYFLEYDIGNLKPDDKHVKKDWDAIKNSTLSIVNTNGVLSIDNRISSGNKITRKFFSNLFEIKSGNRPSVVELIKDRASLWKIIRNRVGNTLIYCDCATGSTKALKGIKKCCAECPGDGSRHMYPMTITPRMILVQGPKASGGATHASVFKPTVAKAIYNKYIKDGDKILDISCGFGNRLCGLMASGKNNIIYYGYEPNRKTHNGIYEMAEFLGFKDKIDIKQCGSEEEIFGENIIDFAFSSPPYYTQEVYSTDPLDKQCYNTFPKYEDWLEKYWRQTVKNAKKMLKPDALFVNNIGNDSNPFMSKLKTDMAKIIEEEGFKLIEEINMVTSRSHLTNKRTTQSKVKFETIFVHRNNK